MSAQCYILRERTTCMFPSPMYRARPWLSRSSECTMIDLAPSPPPPKFLCFLPWQSLRPDRGDPWHRHLDRRGVYLRVRQEMPASEQTPRVLCLPGFTPVFQCRKVCSAGGYRALSTATFRRRSEDDENPHREHVCFEGAFSHARVAPLMYRDRKKTPRLISR